MSKKYNFVAKDFGYSLSMGGKDYGEVNAAVIVIPNAIKSSYGVMDATIYAEDKNGDVINFKSVEEAQDWIDKYGDDVELHIEHGDEIHATPHQDLDESLNEDLKSTQKQYSYIPETDFFEIISLDPTYNPDRDSVGKYGKWLLGLYKKDNPLNHENTEIYNLLSQYDKYKNDRKYQIEKDINKFKSFDDLSDAIDSVDDAELSDRQKERELRTSSDYKVVYKDNDWTIYVPLSYAGSCTLGKGTTWCTAYSNDDSYYNDYTEEGPLYILINNKNKSKKYQFHFETESFMDADDDRINIGAFLEQFPNIAEFFEIRTHIVCSGKGIRNADPDLKMFTAAVDIEEGTKEIEDWAFKNCESLQSITIPNSVTDIGESAFKNCTSLKSITIPNSITYIGDNAFAYCESLQSITLPNSVTDIGDGAFQHCYSLKSITLPNSINSISRGVFCSCGYLESITIPNSVTSIGDRAFYSCGYLESITIPNSVTRIGEYAFFCCHSLKTLVTTKNSYAERYFKKKYPDVQIEYLNTNESLNETAKPTYTYSYVGPVYRFEKLYDTLREPVYTTAQNKKHASTMLKGKLKQKYGFAPSAKLDIEEKRIREINPLEYEDERDYYDYWKDRFKEEPEDAEIVASIDGNDIYYKDGYYKIAGNNMTFVSEEEAREFLEDR